MHARTKKAQSSTSVMRGVIYARYSSHNQKEESIEQQVEECQKFAAEKNIVITHIYADKAISGKTDKRTQFQRMMRDAEKQEFDVVIAYKSNRISRNMYNALGTEARLLDLGIKLLYAKEGFDDTASGRFAQRSMMNINQFYAENMAEDIKRGMRDNAESCKVNGSLPYGYKRGEDGKYAIDEPRAAVIREIFDKYNRGIPNVEICDSLNARGIRTKTGGPWTRTSFARILANERYIGVYEHSGVRVEGGVPAIISEEVFYMAQKRSREKPKAVGVRKKGRSAYLLTGKLICGDCGSPMVGISGTSRNGDLHYYYTCQSKHNGVECSKSNVRRELVEQVVIDMLLDAITTETTLDFLTSDYGKSRKKAFEDPELSIMQTELAESKKALANILKAIENGIFNSSTNDRMKELEDNIRELERDIRCNTRMLELMPTEDEFRFFLEEIRNKNVDDADLRQSLISSFVYRVWLWDDWIEVEYNFTGGDPNNKKEKRPFTRDITTPKDSPVSPTTAGSVRTESSQPHHEKSQVK